MAGNEVTLSVRSQLLKIIDELDKINDKQKEVQNSFKESGKVVGDAMNDQAKKTENFLGKMGNLGRRVADQLRGDFKTLVSINALTDAFKLSNQFRGSIRETVQLSDSIRKLGVTFGITSDQYSKFQSRMASGLGKLGLSSQVGANVLEGLSQSNTRMQDQGSIVNMAALSGQLASVTRSQGQEGEIAKLMAQVMQARGVSPDNVKEQSGLAEDIRRAFNATGANATDTLKNMKDIFGSMSQDMRKAIGTRGLTNIAAVSTVAGAGSVKFFQELLGKSPIMRKALEAQGFKGVITDKGIDMAKFAKASQSVLGRVGGDPRVAAQTLGLTDDVAEGFVRLATSLDQVAKVQEQVSNATGDLNTQYQQSMGLGEAFGANINRFKDKFSALTAPATQGLTSLLSGTAQSDIGAGAAVAGGGALAALLAGFGTRGIGKALGGGALGGLAKAGATEAITGRQVVPVFVTNASEMAGGGVAGAAGGIMGKAGGFLGKAGGVLGAGALAYEAGGALNEHVIDKFTQGKTSEGFEGNAIERLIFSIEKLVGTERARGIEKAQKMIIELNKSDLKQSKQPTRGSSF